MSSTEPKSFDTLLSETWGAIVEQHVEKGITPITGLHDALKTALRAAYAAGERTAGAEYNLIHDSMAKTHADRMGVMTSTITAGLMRHLNLTELTINPDDMATVWRQHKLSSCMNPDKTITYTLEHTN